MHGIQIERDCLVMPKTFVMLSAAKHLAIGTVCGHGTISDGAQRLRHVGSALSVRSFALLRMTTREKRMSPSQP